jgi:pSer/pThr/pTyr-binding forkhead associated (FHA) protein
MSTFQPLFTVEETLARLGQSRSKGCILVFNAREAIHIFVLDGNIISALTGDKSGEEAVDHALALTDSSYRWIPDAEPTQATIKVSIADYIAGRSQTREVRYKTIRMATYQKRERKLDFQYFLVPEETPTTKLRLKKAVNVAGRDNGSDLQIDNFQVSRRHCLLEVTENGVMVRDLDSTNGTFINGAPAKDGYLNEGDRLSLGTYGLTLRRGPAEGASRRSDAAPEDSAPDAPTKNAPGK